MRAVRWIIDTAGSITGTRFRLVIASSSTATALIIGSSLASGGDSGLASQLAQALSALGGSSQTPAATTPAPTPSAAAASKGGGGATPVSPVPVTTPATTTTPQAKTPKTKTPKAGRVKHVFVISLASPGYENAFGAQSEMPYLASLRPQGELLSNYTLLTDKGLPNYIGMIGGQSPNALTSGDCTTYTDYPGNAQPDRNGNVAGNGCIYPAQAINLADQLFSARFSWGAYMEDMGKPEPVAQGETAPANPPQNCVRPDVNAADPTQDVRKADPSTGYAGSGYAVRHNPFAYFHSLLDLGSCAQKDVPLDRLDGALAAGTPNFTFISPNLCNSGEPTECDTDIKDPGPAQADKFLSTWVPKILASPAYQQDGVLIVTFGEATPGVDSAPVGTLLLSKFLTPGSTNAGAFNPYSIFRTVEDLFGLQRIAAGARTGTTTFASDLLGSQKKKHKKKK
jgi:hypothetical protein